MLLVGYTFLRWRKIVNANKLAALFKRHKNAVTAVTAAQASLKEAEVSLGKIAEEIERALYEAVRAAINLYIENGTGDYFPESFVIVVTKQFVLIAFSELRDRKRRNIVNDGHFESSAHPKFLNEVLEYCKNGLALPTNISVGCVLDTKYYQPSH